MTERTGVIVQRALWTLYIVALSMVVYATVQVSSLEVHGAPLFKQAKSSSVDLAAVTSAAKSAAASHPPSQGGINQSDLLNDIQAQSLQRHCAVANWLSTVPSSLKFAGFDSGEFLNYGIVCQNQRLVSISDSFPHCESSKNPDQDCPPDTPQKTFIAFSRALPVGNLETMFEDIDDHADALLTLVETIWLPFFFGAIGGALGVLFSTDSEHGIRVASGPLDFHAVIRPLVGGLAALLICYLFAKPPVVDHVYSLNWLALVVGYGADILPVALNAGVRQVRTLLTQQPSTRDAKSEENTPTAASSEKQPPSKPRA